MKRWPLIMRAVAFGTAVAVTVSLVPAQSHAAPAQSGLRALAGSPLAGGKALAIPGLAAAAGVSVAAAVEGTTITVDIEGGFDSVRMQQLLNELDARNDLLSDTIQEDLDEYAEDYPDVEEHDWVDFDGTLSTSGSAVSLTIPADEVDPQASFWVWLAAVATGYIVGQIARLACYGFFSVGAPLAGPACAAVAGFVTGFVSNLIVVLADKRGTDPVAWAQIFAAGLLGAISGAAWEAGINNFAKTQMKPLFDKIGNAIKSKWQAAGEKIKEWSTLLRDKVLELAREYGWEPSVDDTQLVAVASYIHPGADPGAWNRLIGSPTSKLAVLVANVLNGPDSTRSAMWADVIDRGHASGKRVLGYVPTGYLGQTGIRTRLGSTAVADWVAQIEQDINTWYALYGGSMDGIFFDEGFNVCGANNEFAAIYTELNQYEKRRHPGALTILNPGTVVPQCYEDTADVLLTFESDYAAYIGQNPNAALNYRELDWEPNDPSKIWHIVYNVGAGHVQEVVDLSRERGAGYVEVTDDVMANPYDNLPSPDYWSAEVNAVSGGEPTVGDPAPYTSGGAAPSSPSGLSVGATDYSSTAITWSAASNAARYFVYLNGQVVASLPTSMTSVTIGGLSPGGNSYQLRVTAQASSGVESAPSNTVTVTTLSLPGGKAITNERVTVGGGTASYSADFLTPYSFHRIYIWRDDANSGSAPCWTINYNSWDFVCTVYMIENSTLFVYSGATAGQWSWTPIAYVPPTVNGYTYTWAAPISSQGSGPAALPDHFVVQGEGYGPFTNIFHPCPLLICTP